MKIDGIANVLSKTYNVSISSATQQNDTFAFTFDYKNVCLEYVLDNLTERYNIGYEKTQSGYTIYAPQVMSKIFNLNYHNFNRQASSSVNINSSNTLDNNISYNNNSSSITTKMEDSFWKNIISSIKVIIKEESSQNVIDLRDDIEYNQTISVDNENGIIIVRAMPRALKRVAQFINNVKRNCLKQVMIEAKILEVTLTDEFQHGIDWKMLGNKIGNVLNFDSIGNNSLSNESGLISGVFNGNLNFGEGDKNNFQSFISILSTQGAVSVLSSPKISTLNNQRAMIKFGDDQYYILKSTNGTAVQQSSTGATNTTPISSFETKGFFSGIALDTTPTITKDQQIVMHIHPVITRVTKDEQTVTINGNTNKLIFPKIENREADTIVKANSGDIIVIGGLSENKSDLQQTGPSGQKKILSIVGQTKKNSSKKELIILLRPIIIDSYDTDNLIDEEKFLIKEDITGF
ncbi:MAG: hypothetical protein U1E31_02950 [Rickettsiales bacterium]